MTDEKRHHEALERIRDIRRRIEELRSRLHPTQGIHRQKSVAKNKPPMARTREEQEKKNAELADIKAKLLGKRP